MFAPIKDIITFVVSFAKRTMIKELMAFFVPYLFAPNRCIKDICAIRTLSQPSIPVDESSWQSIQGRIAFFMSVIQMLMPRGLNLTSCLNSSTAMSRQASEIGYHKITSINQMICIYG